jgi:hypothetical protein
MGRSSAAAPTKTTGKARILADLVHETLKHHKKKHWHPEECRCYEGSQRERRFLTSRTSFGIATEVLPSMC